MHSQLVTHTHTYVYALWVTVTVHSQVISIECLYTRDRSWGQRPVVLACLPPALHAYTQTHRLAVLSNQRKLSNEWLSTLHCGHLALSPWQHHQSSTAPVLHWSTHTSTQQSLHHARHPNTGANTNMYCICNKVPSETEVTIQHISNTKYMWARLRLWL